jgi:aryl-alcohol dehydrogenase-like predicted oxidoreductase
VLHGPQANCFESAPGKGIRCRRQESSPRCRREQIQAYEDLLAKHGLEPGEAALAWLLTRPGVTSPIVGPRTADQLASTVRAVDLELGQEVLDGLDGIFPGLGPSPEAFAW